MRGKANFDERPSIAIWETTQACDLACAHCRAVAQPSRDAGELTTAEAKHLIDEIAAMEVPVFVLTGGDPLMRPDIFVLVQYASGRNVRVSLTPSATPHLTRESVVRLKECGLARLDISLDGPSDRLHDAVRSVPGSFQWTFDAARWARQIGLPVQINTTLTRHNVEMLDEIVDLLETLDITQWSVFFLVPSGGASGVDLISALEFEQVFEKLYRASQRVLFNIKTNEARHYRRYVFQRRTEVRQMRQQPSQTYTRIPQFSRSGADTLDDIGSVPCDSNDAQGFVFISHLGEVHPSRFLPLSGGNLRRQSLSDIYRNSLLFRKLRDSRNLEGKCGMCEYRESCGGSRARSFAMTGNLFAEEPCCVYEPKRHVGARDEAESVAV